MINRGYGFLQLFCLVSPIGSKNIATKNESINAPLFIRFERLGCNG